VRDVQQQNGFVAARTLQFDGDDGEGCWERGGTSMEDGEEATMGFAGDMLCTAAGYRQPSCDLSIVAFLYCERERSRDG
jgi:hypothetical protein